MKNSALSGFCSRFESILDELDEFEMDEDLEELNAQLEDALFFMRSLDEEEEDSEETQGALEEVEGLLAEYQALSERRPELRQKVLELEMAVEMAKRNLN